MRARRVPASSWTVSEHGVDVRVVHGNASRHPVGGGGVQLVVKLQTSSWRKHHGRVARLGRVAPGLLEPAPAVGSCGCDDRGPYDRRRVWGLHPRLCGRICAGQPPPRPLQQGQAQRHEPSPCVRHGDGRHVSLPAQESSRPGCRRRLPGGGAAFRQLAQQQRRGGLYGGGAAGRAAGRVQLDTVRGRLRARVGADGRGRLRGVPGAGAGHHAQRRQS
mmetsp:Transcript_12111/g.23006  ORF Transcript_12111/g.23006 Transcript_12111/m.23006 type:complete len:218 (-) Transcript_12111:211-864(-)